MMTLLDINLDLEETLEKIKKVLPDLTKAENEYYLKLGKLILTDNFHKNAADREAAAKSALSEEGILETYQALKLKMRILLHEKEITIELGRNMRSPNWKSSDDLPF